MASETQERRGHAQRAAQGSTDGLWDWCATTGEAWFSDRFCGLLDLACSETGRSLDTWLCRIGPGESAGISDALHRCAETGEPFDQNFRLLASSGEYRWFRARGSRCSSDDGASVFVSGGIQDIHQHRLVAEAVREKESQLMQRERLEAIDCLAGGIAHEFNNALQAIDGYLSFAQLALEPECQAYEDLSQAKAAAGRAARLTRDLLDFARSDEPCEVVADLTSVVDGLAELLRPVIGEHIELRLAAPSEPLRVSASVAEVRQAVLNLCINARDAMPEGGVLALTAEPFVVDGTNKGAVGALRPGAYGRLMVTDSGCGIPSDILERIFDPFFTTKEAGVGTGLGLATVYGFVGRCGGHVGAHSDGDGAGATFSIYLPISTSTPNTESRPVSNQQLRPLPRCEGKILVVEDDPLVRDVARRILEGAGFGVLSAADGEEALETYIENAESIVMVLLDVVLPRLSGRRVFEQIRRLQSEVPIAFCSGYDPQSVQLEPLGKLADAALSKPFDRRQLLDVVDRLVTGAGAPASDAASETPAIACPTPS